MGNIIAEGGEQFRMSRGDERFDLTFLSFSERHTEIYPRGYMLPMFLLLQTRQSRREEPQ